VYSATGYVKITDLGGSWTPGISNNVLHVSVGMPCAVAAVWCSCFVLTVVLKFAADVDRVPLLNLVI
jgi:hypothetical protein